MAACDYCLSDYSDDGHSLDDEDCGPSRECFHVDLGGHDEGNHLGMPEDDDPPRPAPRVDILRELAVVPVPAVGSGRTARANPRDAGQARRGSKTTCAAPAEHRAEVGRPSTGRRSASSGPGRLAPHRRRCQGKAAPGFQWGRPEPGCSSNTTPSDAGTIHHRGATYPGRAQESPGGCRGPTGRKLCFPKAGYPPEHRAATSRFMREASVHTGRTRDTAPAAPGRLGKEHHRRDRRAHLDEKVRRGYHPRRGGRYDSGEDQSPSPEPPGSQAFSRAIRRAPFSTRFRTPTTITKYSGETRPELWLANYRLVCQLGGTDDDNLIIRNLPLFLSDAARAWLEHLPPAQISNWVDLVKAFAGNFQGTYVRPGNSWDLRSCRQQPGESLRDYILRFSKQRTELPNITDSDVIGAFLAGTTCRDLVSKLGRKTLTRASELMDIATKFASGQVAVEDIFRKDKQP
jgi:hypothetical protein